LQFAFTPVKGKGCEVALSLIQHKVLKFLDERSGAVRILQVDLSKAFDKTCHPTALDALARFEIPKECYLWIRSFLSGRFQRVKSLNEHSDWYLTPSGVPQGSVTGPVIFAALVEDLVPISHNSTIVKYADDMTLLHFIRDNTEDILQEEFNNIMAWSDKVHLPVNLSKTCVMNYNTKRSLKIPDLPNIETVHATKLLGVTLSDNLKWNTHYDHILPRTARRLHMLTQLKAFGASAEWIWRVYNAHIRSVLCYGYPSTCNMSKAIWKKMLTIERRATRIAGCEPQVNLASFTEQCCKKLIHQAKDTDHPLHELIRISVPGRPTRTGKSNIAPVYAQTTRLKNSLTRYASL
jgi:hypothetical protein